MHGGEIFSSVEFQMSLLLFVALSGYVLASFLSQPAVVGEILAGIVIGPIEQPSFVAIIIMSLITTLIVPVMLR